MVRVHACLAKSVSDHLNARFKVHLPFYQTQFSRPANAEGLVQGASLACGSYRQELIIALDGYSDFFAFSTGRRALTSLHTTFTLRPRHDLFQCIYQLGRGLVELDYQVSDIVELEFTFREPVGKDGAVPECVWAVVAKDEMKRIRNDRWDMVRRSFFFAHD